MDRAEQMIDDIDREAIIASFLSETEEGLNLMEQSLVSLESNMNVDSLLDEIFRVVHTIKGNAASLGYPALAGFAHAGEDLLDVLRNSKISVAKETVSLLLAAVDALRALVPCSVA